MKLPNGDRAIVEDSKLVQYVLNPAHPIGRHHAILFEKLLGITRENSNFLKTALLGAARNETVSKKSETPYGTKYEIRFDFENASKSKRVVSVWIIDRNQDGPRLVTCYVE